MPFIIRNLQQNEYDMVRVWGNKEQFDRGTYDFQAFRYLDKNTWWIGQLDGEPIASIAVAQYDQSLASIGLYYVKSEHRGKGYGLQVWKKAFEHITATNIGLSSGRGKAQQIYQTQGFKTYHKTYLMTSIGTGKPYISQFLVDCHTIDFKQLSEYDQQYFPGDRKEFLQKWINLPQCQAKAFIRDGKIEGYGVLRVSDKGHRIGPLFANSYEVADEVLKGLKGSIKGGKRVRMDIPSINKQIRIKISLSSLFFSSLGIEQNVYKVATIQKNQQHLCSDLNRNGMTLKLNHFYQLLLQNQYFTFLVDPFLSIPLQKYNCEQIFSI